MATYKATQRGYIGRVIEPGEVFEYDGKPGKWMEEVKAKDAKPAKEEVKAKDAKHG